MKITLFDRQKYNNAIKLLEAKRMPSYVIEAYKEGYYDVVNHYNKIRLEKKLGKHTDTRPINESVLKTKLKDLGLEFLNEASRKNDEDFIKSFFTMTNLDIFSGRRLPPSAGSMLRQDVMKDLGLKDLFKKLR